jgi:N-acetylmuramoyl-L-alanine amidase
MRRSRGPLTTLALVGTLLGGPAPALAARMVAVDLGTAAGARLGRLVGELRGPTAYFPLAEVARLVGATIRTGPGGDRVSVVGRHGRLDLVRDSAQVTVGSRVVDLGTPVRVRQGRWQVPGELLVRALPALLGTGLRVAPADPAAGPIPARAAPGRARATPVRPSPPPARPAGPRPAPATVAAAVEPERPPPAPEADPEPTAGGASRAASAPEVARGPGPSRGAARASHVELRFRSYPTYTRVVVEADGPLEPRLVESEGALVVALPGLSARPAMEARTVRDGLVSRLELGVVRSGPALTVEFDRPPAARRVLRLDEPPRLVLDFYRQPGRRAATPGGGPEPLRTVVIDPGHGGHDPGARGAHGLQEKELTLDVARRVAALLQEDGGLRVILTRSRDQFVALRERTALANRERADLFLSIHANAAPDATATGAETYFLSTEATDGAARRAAEDENRVIALEPNPRGGPTELLRSILWDLAQSDFQQESSRVAETLQTQLDRALRRPSRGVKQAPFYVLGGAAMPAILVEIGFITNPREEEQLRDDGYRDRIARALAAGLLAYKRGYDQRVGVARQ